MKIYFFTFTYLLLTFSSCSLLRTITGNELDPERFVKAREAKVLEIRTHSAEQLQKRLTAPDPIDNADIVMFIRESALNQTAHLYDSTNGWLDEKTRMLIRSASIKLYNGVVVLSLVVDAQSESYFVTVRLTMDCVLYLSMNEQMQLIGRLEVFNISPDVEAGGVLSGQEELIRNLVSIKLALFGEQMPPFIFPIDFTQQTAIEKFDVRTKEKIDLSISSPRRLLNYTLQLKEILIFQGKILVAMNVKKVEVK